MLFWHRESSIELSRFLLKLETLFLLEVAEKKSSDIFIAKLFHPEQTQAAPPPPFPASSIPWCF